MKTQLIKLILLTTFVAHASIVVGQKGPNNPELNYFDYTTIDGVEGSLDQFHGCKVFISFWSKVCRPCIRSFQKHRELRQRLMDEGAIIINASLDNDTDWRAAVSQHNPNGLNISMKKAQLVQRHYDVYFLPVYVTLDIDGYRVEKNDESRDILQFADWFDKSK